MTQNDQKQKTYLTSYLVAMSGKMLVNQRRQFHPFHLFDEQRNVIRSCCKNISPIFSGGYLYFADSGFNTDVALNPA
jgi:hypothetical protein